MTPQITLGQIEDRIASEHYHTVDGCFTVCILKMANGFYITGQAASQGKGQTQPAQGSAVAFMRELARYQAVRKAQELELYLLKEQVLTQRGTGKADAA